jgi:hypothetical protein
MTFEPSAVPTQGQTQASRCAQRIHTVSDYLIIDFLGGPRPLKLA